jgi:hypothetical protein
MQENAETMKRKKQQTMADFVHTVNHSLTSRRKRSGFKRFESASFVIDNRTFLRSSVCHRYFTRIDAILAHLPPEPKQQSRLRK